MILSIEGVSLIVIQMIENIIRRLFRIRTLPDKNRLHKFLRGERLCVADIGAAGNPKGIWHEAADFTNFILFDPDFRASMSSGNSFSSVHRIGLWSETVEREIYLAVNPEASSVYEFNTDVVNDFLNAPLHKILGQETIVLDSKTNVLGERQNPDFIKVDAEGADLEILKGAEHFLRNSCLGAFIEVSFAERHKGAPFFGDTDAYMRSLNFMCMDLYLERWIRTNNMFKVFSRPQLIWGNALYLLNRSEFLDRLRAIEPVARKGLFAKFLIILLLFQAHDYAYEITLHALQQNLIEQSQAEETKQIIAESMAHGLLNLTKLVSSIFLSCVGLVLFSPFQKLRYNNLLFLKVQLGELCHAALQFSAHRYKGIVVDPADPSSRL